jgi:hypothetical protein
VLAIAVSLLAPFTQTVTVTATTVQGSALAGKDYKTTTTTLTFAAGVTTVFFNVQIIGDTVHESTETFTVSLTNPSSNAVLVRSSATVTITDNDSLLVASQAAPSPASSASLAPAQISSALAGARTIWAGKGLDTSALDAVRVELVDLPGATLGEADGDVIRLDVDAAGWGWTVLGGRIDLTRVLAHELGHVLGLDHDDAVDSVMHETLAVGTPQFSGHAGWASLAISQVLAPGLNVNQTPDVIERTHVSPLGATALAESNRSYAAASSNGSAWYAEQSNFEETRSASRIAAEPRAGSAWSQSVITLDEFELYRRTAFSLALVLLTR